MWISKWRICRIVLETHQNRWIFLNRLLSWFISLHCVMIVICCVIKWTEPCKPKTRHVSLLLTVHDFQFWSSLTLNSAVSPVVIICFSIVVFRCRRCVTWISFPPPKVDLIPR
jgi:hypothetical protein